MLRLQTLREFSDRCPVAAGIAPDLQQQQILLRFDSVLEGKLLAEPDEFADLITKIRKRLEIAFAQGAGVRFRHGASSGGAIGKTPHMVAQFGLADKRVAHPAPPPRHQCISTICISTSQTSRPGKVNPTQCEALTMLCCQIIANDVAVGIGGSAGNFELNVYKSLVAHNFLQSVRLLADGMTSFETHCVRGIEAKRAHQDSITLRQAALALGHVTAEESTRWVKPAELV